MKEKYLTICWGCNVGCYFTSKKKEEKRKKTCRYCYPCKPQKKGERK